MPSTQTVIDPPTHPRPHGGPVPSAGRPDPASPAAAAGRLFALDAGLGLLGLLGAALAVARPAGRIALGPHGAMHHLTLFGQPFTYPQANLSAVAVIVLAAAGLIVLMRGASGVVREIVLQRRLRKMLDRRTAWRLPGGARVIDHAHPHAFCAGLIRPRVYVSSPTLTRLDERALQAVLAHEAHHARRRDPLRLAMARMLERALFFVPALGQLRGAYEALAEISADDAAVKAAHGDSSALAAAMLSLSDDSAAPGGGIDPARVDHLLGEPTEWRLPLRACAAGAAAVALFAGLALLLGRTAVGHATLALPFLVRQPCLVALLALPTAGALLTLRRLAGRRPSVSLAAGRSARAAVLTQPGAASPRRSARSRTRS